MKRSLSNTVNLALSLSEKHNKVLYVVFAEMPRTKEIYHVVDEDQKNKFFKDAEVCFSTANFS